MLLEATVSIKEKEFNRINRLLAIPSLYDMTDNELLAAGANTDQHEGIFAVRFSDGSTLTYDLCSGQSNYFDDVVWTSADGTHDIVLDCMYELDDIEFEHDGVTYCVHIRKSNGIMSIDE